MVLRWKRVLVREGIRTAAGLFRATLTNTFRHRICSKRKAARGRSFTSGLCRRLKLGVGFQFLSTHSVEKLIQRDAFCAVNPLTSGVDLRIGLDGSASKAGETPGVRVVTRYSN